jgi:phytanoyl-CoA hydroxylase
MTDALDDAALERALADYREQGFGRLGRVVDDATLTALRQRADDLMLGCLTIPGLFFQHDASSGRYEDLVHGAGWIGPSLDYRKLEKLEKDDLFHALLSSPVFERAARAVIGGDIVIYRAVLFHKGAAGGSNLPWHQDGGRFWGLDRDPVLQIWTALDDAPEDGGCVEVLPGSHHHGLVSPLGGLVQPEHVAARHADARAVKVPARAGEVLLLHNHCWHRSGRSATGRPRRAFTVCYMSAATRCTRKKHAPRAFVRVFG